MKNSKQEHFDQVLKDQLAEGTTPVPGFVWDRIEAELFPEKKRRGFFWWFFGGLSVLLIGTSLITAFYGSPAHSQHPVSKISGHAILKEESVNEKGNYTALNLFKTKGCSQYRELATEDGKSTVFQQQSKNQPSHRQSLKNHSKFQLAAKTKSGKPHPGNNLPEELNAPSNTLNTSRPDTHSDNPENETKQDNTKKKPDNFTKTPLSDEPLDYAEIIELIERDFIQKPEKQETKPNKPSLFSIGIYGGPSLYHTAVFKDYFTSGQLSKRTFASSGFELGLQARFRIGNRFKVYAGFAFNNKQTQFNYNVAITQEDYFTYLVNEEKIPLEHIHDDGTNSCFLAENVYARYRIQTASLSLGTSFEFLKTGKFSAAADIRLSCNVNSSLKLDEMKVLDIAQPSAEKFSCLQPGIGILLDYRLNKRISIGLAPFFSKQFYLKESFSRKLDELIIPVTVSFEL